MAYRKTAKIEAHMEKRSDRIVAAAIRLLAWRGREGLTVDAVAEQADVSAGTIYTYFPSMDELFAQAVQQLLERDLELIRGTEAKQAYPINALIKAIEVWYASFAKPRLVRVLRDAPAYREGVTIELERLIKACGLGPSPKARQMAAGAALGAVYGVYDVSDGSKNGASAASAFVVRGLGIPWPEGART